MNIREAQKNAIFCPVHYIFRFSYFGQNDQKRKNQLYWLCLKMTADFRNFVAKTDEKRKSKDEMNRTIIEHFQRTLPKFYYVNCAQMYSWLRVLQEFPIIKSTPHSKFCKLCTKVPTIKEPNIGLFQNTPVFSLLMCVVFFDMILNFIRACVTTRRIGT